MAKPVETFFISRPNVGIIRITMIKTNLKIFCIIRINMKLSSSLLNRMRHTEKASLGERLFKETCFN